MVVGLALQPDWRASERGGIAHFGNCHVANDRSDAACAYAVVLFGCGPWANRPVRRRSSLHRRSIAAIEKSKETWFEAEVNRIAGKLTLVSPEHDATKAEAYFNKGL